MNPPSWQSDYDRFQKDAGQLSLSDVAIIDLLGCDRVKFLHSFCTQDIKGLAVGHGAEAFVTNHQGKTIGYGVVLALPDRLRFITSSGQATKLITHWDRFVIAEDVQFRDQSAEVVTLIVGGPNVKAKLQEVLGSTITLGQLDTSWRCQQSADVVVTRTSIANLESWYVQSSRTTIHQLVDRLKSNAVGPVVAEVWVALQLESRLPRFGTDITDECLPQEIDRDQFAINFRKGCYLGQETVARLDALGHVNWKLVSVRWLAPVETPPSPPISVAYDNKEVGQVTSLIWSPRHESLIGLARIRANLAKPATRLHTAFGEIVIL